jgi:uncharacterized cupin superfamily protein
VSDHLPANRPADAASVEIVREAIDPSLVVAGAPSAGATPLAELDMVEIGVWEMSAGTARDTEVDEVFVVISGRATVEVADGPRYEIGAGDIVRLSAGDQTIWTVHEVLRKVYVALG